MSRAEAESHLRRRWRGRGAAYSLGYLALAPLAAGALAHRLWVRRRALVGLDEKLLGDGPELPTGLIMLHGVSLGEVTLMRALVPRLDAALGGALGAQPLEEKAQRDSAPRMPLGPGRRPACLLTTTTETGRQGLDRHFPDNPRAFLPLDVPWAVNRFLGRAKPRLVVLLESELWPILLCACAARGIPVALANARISERSYRRFLAAGAATRPLFRAIALALPQNGLYAARLARLGVPRERLRVCGSMKADIVALADAAAVAAERDRLHLGAVGAERPILLCASTSAGEERPLIAAWKRSFAGWRLIICPRHPERGAEIAAQCAALGIAAARSSLGQVPTADGAIVVDEIGRLGALYALTAATAGVAVVGGSLGSGRGGQNMLEAAGAGCCTVVGWDTRSQPDSMQLLRANAGVVELTQATLDAQLAELAADPGRRRQLGAAARDAWASGRGAGERAAEAITGLARSMVRNG